MTKRLILALLFSCPPLWATTYYVDNCVSVGNDRNNGTSTSTPWLTINKVNTSKFNPGDSILFESTCTWREQLTVPSSGSSGSPITFGAYGTGAAPIISGANLFTSWTLSSGSVYYTSYSTAPNQVFEDGGRLTQSTVGTASLTAGQWYLDTVNSRIWVYLTAGDSPSGHTMEASQRQYAIYGSGISYVTISGLEASESNGAGSSEEAGSGIHCNTCTNLLVTGVTVLYNYNDGVRLDYGSNNVVSYSRAAYNGANGFANYGAASLFDHLVAYYNNQLAGGDGEQSYGAGIKFDSAPNQIVQYSTSYGNGVGQSPVSAAVDGIWCDTCGSGFTAQYNLVYDNTGEGIFVEANSGQISVLYNVVYGNLDWGIELAADNTSIPMSGSIVAGNTSYGNAGAQIAIDAANFPGGCVNNLVYNNIAFQVSGNTPFRVYGGCENPGTNGSGNVYTYNNFGTATTNFIEWGHGVLYSTYSSWETATGNCGTVGCSHSIEAAPTFANASAGQFWLTSGSPGIGAGLNLGSPYNIGLMPGSAWPTGVTTGPTNTPPDIGAFVYVPPVALIPPSNLLVLSVH